MPIVQSGLDRFLGPAGRPWRKKRLGLMVHGASVTSRLEHTVDALRRKGFRLSALFAPEHGLAADLQDQAPVQGARDPLTKLPQKIQLAAFFRPQGQNFFVQPTVDGGPEPTGESRLPVFSLYGKTLSPTPAMLSQVDALVFDLQDIGVRYYTFIWTMALAMKACAESGKPFIVLDRPNPLGGNKIEGNLPDPGFASFVGLLPLPVLHGMTTGELARHFNRTQKWDVDLHVIPMAGWKRSMGFNDTGLPWVLPSPNMPTLDTAAVYGGMCLLEATNLSEGRGTTRPFEIVGAPFLDGARLAQQLAAQRLPGVTFRPVSFRPTFNKWAGELCGGVQLHVTDPARFQPFRTGVTFLHTVHRLSPKFRWKNPPYEYETQKKPMDILCGTDIIRRAIDQGSPLGQWENAWRLSLNSFRQNSKQDQLYL